MTVKFEVGQSVITLEQSGVVETVKSGGWYAVNLSDGSVVNRRASQIELSDAPSEATVERKPVNLVHVGLRLLREYKQHVTGLDTPKASDLKDIGIRIRQTARTKAIGPLVFELSAFHAGDTFEYLEGGAIDTLFEGFLDFIHTKATPGDDRVEIDEIQFRRWDDGKLADDAAGSTIGAVDQSLNIVEVAKGKWYQKLLVEVIVSSTEFVSDAELCLAD